MALENFKLVNTQGLKGLNFNGDHINFEDITDELAEKLMGKTHVLERVGDAPAAPQLALSEGEAGKKKDAPA